VSERPNEVVPDRVTVTLGDDDLQVPVADLLRNEHGDVGAHNRAAIWPERLHDDHTGEPHRYAGTDAAGTTVAGAGSKRITGAGYRNRGTQHRDDGPSTKTCTESHATSSSFG